MIPVLQFFGKEISIYQIMTLAGIFTAGPYAMYVAKRHGKDNNEMLTLLLISAIGVFIGMHLVYGLTMLPYLRSILQQKPVTDFKSFIQVAGFILGGSVFYGGLLGGMLSGFLYGRKKGLDLLFWSDLVAPVIPFFHFFGRIGCFLGGCCYGLPCSLGFTYHYSPIPGANDVVRFPIQLVEAGFNLLLFFLLNALLNKGKCKGKLLSIYLGLYSVARFTLEFFRGDEIRGFLFGLSTSQWISLLIFGGVILYTIHSRKKESQK